MVQTGTFIFISVWCASEIINFPTAQGEQFLFWVIISKGQNTSHSDRFLKKDYATDIGSA